MSSELLKNGSVTDEPNSSFFLTLNFNSMWLVDTILTADDRIMDYFLLTII